MQINVQPSIRPVPVRRKQTSKLDAGKSVPSFESQIQSANSNLNRQYQSKITPGADDQAPGDSSQIDTTA